MSKPVMTKDTMQQTLRWMRQYMKEQPVERLSITIHGGEPLTAGYEYYKVLIEEIEHQFPREIKNINIQSNLWLLDDKFARLFEGHAVSIGTSLDGPPSICDNQRGESYYEHTMKGIEIAERAGIKVGILCTFTSESAHFYKVILNHFSSLQTSVSFHACMPGLTDVSDHSLVIPPEQYGILLNKILDVYLDALTSGLPLEISTLDNYCKSVVNGRANICTFMNCLGKFMAVGPSGNIYPCQRFVGTDFILGHVSQMPTHSQLRNTSTWSLFEERERLVTHECGDCPHFIYCHGGCPYNALAEGKGKFISLRDPYCVAYISIFDRMASQLKNEFFSEENLDVLAKDPFPVLAKGKLRKGPLSMIVNRNFHPMRVFENARRVLTILAIGNIPAEVLRAGIDDDWRDNKTPDQQDSAISDLARRLTAIGIYNHHVVAENKLKELKNKLTQTPQPQKCYIHVTLDCNLQCNHCYLMPSHGNSEFISAEGVINLIRQAARAGHQKIIITGGEPLLHPERKQLLIKLYELKQYWQDLIKKHNFPMDPSRISLRTNMTVSLPPDELKLLGRAVDAVIVSIDGDRESHDFRRGAGSYDSTIKNLKAFIATKPECSVRIGCILKPIDAQGKLGEAVRRLGVELGIAVKIRNFYPIGNAKKMKETGCAEPLWANFSPRETLLKGYFFAASSCGVGNTLDIRPDGSISSCFAFQSLPFELGKTSSNLNGLKELVDKNSELKKIHKATVDTNKVCSKCVIRYLCHGPCRAWSDHLSKNNINPSPRPEDCANLMRENLMLIHQAFQVDERPTAYNKQVSGYGLRLRPNPRFARTSDTCPPLYEIVPPPKKEYLKIQGELV
jgi:uncharacterized protein